MGSIPAGLGRFQRYVAINEEGCYYVDLEGRQVLGHPILFTGCCTLLRLDAIEAVGGFTPGHLTEDLDLSNRLWQAGWKGVYLSRVVNWGEVPFTYDHFRRQQERWVAGSARALREHAGALLRTTALSRAEKLSALRQNAYFTSSLLTAAAIVFVVTVMGWICVGWNTYGVECYLLLLERFRGPLTLTVLVCLCSTFVEPVLMILVKQRRWVDLVHVPMSVWYVWSTLHTLVSGNLKGFLGVRMGWFLTPKLDRRERVRPGASPMWLRTINGVTGLGILLFYFLEGYALGWNDVFSLLWVPAFLLAVAR